MKLTNLIITEKEDNSKFKNLPTNNPDNLYSFLIFLSIPLLSYLILNASNLYMIKSLRRGFVRRHK